MQKIMKSSAIETVIVRLNSDNISEFNIDTEIFDDPFMEAATRAVEKTRKMRYGTIRAVTECWLKSNPKKSMLYNTFWVLVNASCFSKATLLRDKFMMQTKCDLSKEPIHGKNNGRSTY